VGRGVLPDRLSGDGGSPRLSRERRYSLRWGNRDAGAREQDMQHIIDRILKDTAVRGSSIHGQCHWDRVANFGRAIAEHESVDLRIILLFAYFHDSQRLSDGSDPQHGPRAAEYVRQLPPGLVALDPIDIDRLVFACRYHTHEIPTEDITIHACWDADRLDLGRAGITPDPARLFTETAKQIATACGRKMSYITSRPR
jgi:uncharacterized protein